MTKLKETIEKIWYKDITAEYLSALYASLPKSQKWRNKVLSNILK